MFTVKDYYSILFVRSDEQECCDRNKRMRNRNRFESQLKIFFSSSFYHFLQTGMNGKKRLFNGLKRY